MNQSEKEQLRLEWEIDLVEAIERGTAHLRGRRIVFMPISTCSYTTLMQGNGDNPERFFPIDKLDDIY